MGEFIPNDGQEKALNAGMPLLVLAGAGTGKTTVLAHRIANLVASGSARPDQILALTFADKAAAEMSDRLGSLLADRGLGDAGREVHCSTFHSFGAQMIRDYAPLLGMESDCRVLTTPEAWQLLSRVLGEMEFDAIELPMNGLGSVISGMLSFFSNAKDHLLDPSRLEGWLEEMGARRGESEIVGEYWRLKLAPLAEVLEAYRRYEQAKRERSRLDYGDLLALPVELLDRELVRQSYHDRYIYIFVDEYQDTNYAQKELLMRLLPPAAPIFVIGDDDQSIYGWRGAVLQNILRFGDEPAIRAVGLSTVKLVENRRSGSAVLDLANRVIQGIEKPEEYRKSLLAMDDSPITATVGHYVATSGESEARWIARTIAEKRGTEDVSDLTGKKQGYGAFAVLCRRRSLFPTIAQALEDAEIPYELIGGTGFFGRWEIRDLLSYLRVLSNPADNVALARVLQSRSWRISDRDLFHLSQWARAQARKEAARVEAERSESPASDAGTTPPAGSPDAGPDGVDGNDDLGFRLYDAVANHGDVAGLGPDARTRLKALKELLDTLFMATHRLAMSGLVELVIDRAGYRRELSTRQGVEGDIDAHLALLNLGKLVELARQLQGNEGSLDAFVEYVQYALESGGDESEVRPVDEKSDRVKVMSIHQSKGLEFPVVFVPCLAEGIIPDTNVDNPEGWDQLPEQLRGDRDDYPALDLAGVETEKELDVRLADRKLAHARRGEQEERRLFYVAVTRAQRALYLSRAHWYFSNVKPRKPSPYWIEVVGDDARETGLSTSLGAEPDPGFNPSSLGARSANRETSRGPGLACLILEPDRRASWIAEVAIEMPSLWRQQVGEIDRLVDALARPLPVSVEAPPITISCSGLIQYDECPRLYRYAYLDRLPARPAPWADLGTEVHRLIEELSLRPESIESAGDAAEPEPEPEMDEQAALRHEAEPPHIQSVMANFGRSRFAGRAATRVEESFALPLKGHLVRGRIDRLDRLPDGSWQLADYKVSRYHGHLLRRQLLQMGLYALAAWRLWGIEPESLSCHVLFLLDGHEEVIAVSTSDLLAAETWALDQLEMLRREQYPRTANPETCSVCMHNHICHLEDTLRILGPKEASLAPELPPAPHAT